jgi:DNA-binding NtrC family response regulator
LRTNILILDDDLDVLELYRVSLAKLTGVGVLTESSGVRALERLEGESIDILVTDINMPAINGLEVIKTARARVPDITIMVMTGYPSTETAIQCLRHGAVDFLCKPFSVVELVQRVENQLRQRKLGSENQTLLRQVLRPYAGTDCVGESAAWLALTRSLDQVARTDFDVLISGETGVGKELVARQIYQNSRRAANRFVPVDCGAIPESLVESELFGHERGSFTGAEGKSIGLFELAEGGTLFLDEIGELPLATQSKLLRVLQERIIRRIGGKHEIAVNVRIIAATSRDLPAMVRERCFREDLYYRILVTHLGVPPLRERDGDAVLLARHFIARFARELDRPPASLAQAVEHAIASYSWPGNVRELQNMVKRLLTTCEGPTLTIDHLPEELASATAKTDPPDNPSFFTLRDQQIALFERGYLERLLRAQNGDVSASAKASGIPRGTLYRLLARHRLKPEDFRS